MAITSIWRVSGNIGKVVKYVLNEDKTMRVSELDSVIKYAADMNKTNIMLDESITPITSFVTGVNCYANTAVYEMNAVKERFGKPDGTIAYHGIQSFSPGETTPEVAHEIGIKLARKLWGEKYQVVVATHLDKAHLHTHFVINTVSFVDGRKFHRTKQDYVNMRKISDELCREYGLSVIERNEGKSMHYSQWQAEKEGRPTQQSIIKADFDEAIRNAMTESEFYEYLRRKGYDIKVGKYISVRHPSFERFCRLARRYGDEYSIEGIRKRILENTKRPLPEPKKKYLVIGKSRKIRKNKGLRRLYYHYCYLLGIFPTKNERVNRIIGEDVRKMNKISDEARLLGKYRIDTDEQLILFKESREEKISLLAKDRMRLYGRLGRMNVKGNPEREGKIREEISAINVRLKRLRKEVKVCEGILERKDSLKTKTEVVKEERKEKNYEQLSRCGGTGRQDLA
ncbi:MAG: relaxase/mobilization nuclease domain-containing protein [Eubacteriaceae bacterium]|nr:relaxase/mobilization nuclease domain-containing protein [Eubacteriaceae bacterium]